MSSLIPRSLTSHLIFRFTLVTFPDLQPHSQTLSLPKSPPHSLTPSNLISSSLTSFPGFKISQPHSQISQLHSQISQPHSQISILIPRSPNLIPRSQSSFPDLNPHSQISQPHSQISILIPRSQSSFPDLNPHSLVHSNLIPVIFFSPHDAWKYYLPHHKILFGKLICFLIMLPCMFPVHTTQGSIFERGREGSCTHINWRQRTNHVMCFPLLRFSISL